jgi:hypothetical protein
MVTEMVGELHGCNYTGIMVIALGLRWVLPMGMAAGNARGFLPEIVDLSAGPFLGFHSCYSSPPFV